MFSKFYIDNECNQLKTGSVASEAFYFEDKNQQGSCTLSRSMPESKINSINGIPPSSDLLVLLVEPNKINQVIASFTSKLSVLRFLSLF